MTPGDIHELVIEPSSYCNASCPHCARFTESGHLHPSLPLGHLQISDLSKLNLPELTNLRQVIFEGDKGEPAMNPELLALIDLFPVQVHKIVATNGGIRDEKFWQALAQRPSVEVQFSIDGLATTNHLYRIGVSWSRLEQNARAFIDAGGRAVWRCLVFQHNQHQLDEIQAMSQAWGFERVEFRLPHPERFQGLVSWPVQVRGKLQHSIQLSSLSPAEIRAYNRRHRRLATRHNPWPGKFISACPWAQQRKIYINFQAQVLPCCMMHFETLNDYPGRKKFQEFVVDFDRISLRHADLATILRDTYGNHLELSLHKNPLPVCRKSCYPNEYPTP